MSDYERLRPWTDIDYCKCEEIKRILLAYTLHDNPIHCYECKGTIDPQTLELSAELVAKIANWHRVFSSIYNLWVDAGEYETWAEKELLKKEGQVNQDGVKVAKALSQIKPTYYWWWHDPDQEEFLTCPNCDGNIDMDDKHGSGKCEECCIVA